jgi:putative transposase
MIRILLAFFLDTFKSKSQLQLENLFLRKQLEIALRSYAKRKIKPFDRFFLSRLKDLVISWRDSLLIVKPDTLIKWHQQSFKSYWQRKCTQTDNQKARLEKFKVCPSPMGCTITTIDSCVSYIR